VADAEQDAEAGLVVAGTDDAGIAPDVGCAGHRRLDKFADQPVRGRAERDSDRPGRSQVPVVEPCGDS
jgi:hypothetical protein